MIFKKEHITDICFTQLKPLWLSTSKEFPAFLKPISTDSKMMNEAFIQKRGKEISIHWGKLRKRKLQWIPYCRKRWMKKTETLLNQFLQEESILHLSSYLSPHTFSEMGTEFKKFLYTARQFDAKLSVSDLGQAVRNYLVYAMFLELTEKPQKFTPAIFGYSMLYPVADNFIDSNKSNDEKYAYHMMMRDKINGVPTSPISFHDIQTCKLLSYIETVYPREKEADIYSGLILMLEAQQESLLQQTKEHVLSMEKRLDISLYKGGVSVLVDRYLVDSYISEEERYFFLGFGFILQLADDLQDISSDLLEGRQTLFTLEENPDTLETLMNQLLQFVYQLFQKVPLTNKSFQEFLLHSTILLLLMSAQMSQEHFHTEYLQKLETYFPVRFSFLNQYIKNSALYPRDIEEKDLLRGMDVFLQG